MWIGWVAQWQLTKYCYEKSPKVSGHQKTKNLRAPRLGTSGSLLTRLLIAALVLDSQRNIIIGLSSIPNMSYKNNVHFR